MRASYLLLLLLLCSAGGRGENLQPIALPQLSDSVNPLRVVYAINSRFPKMSPAQLELLLAEARSTVADHFGVEIGFGPIEAIDVDVLFGYLPPGIQAQRQPEIFDFKHGTGNIRQLAEAIENSLRHSMRINGTSLRDEYEFAVPYLLVRPETVSPRSFAEALTLTALQRISVWRTTLVSDGKPVIDDSSYNEWVLWDALGYGELPYDVVLTNQLVASLEYTGGGIHWSLRGGISNGTTSYSQASPYNSFVFLSTFGFVNDFEALLTLRNGERYTREEAARLAGAYLAHELGHQLLHLGHPFGAEGCPMTPAPLLKFREWYEQLDAKKCPLGGHPAMIVGPARIYYNADWVRPP